MKRVLDQCRKCKCKKFKYPLKYGIRHTFKLDHFDSEVNDAQFFTSLPIIYVGRGES